MKTNQEIIANFGHSNKDTGSSKVQIALLTERINHLIGHFNINKKDHHSRRGLLKMVSKRKRLLKYLKSTNYNTYLSTISVLGLRK